jgi:SAM-dependent methyltransferase
VEAYEYQTLYELESTYWWYRHLHAVLLELLLAHAAGSNLEILDAGCGTGQNIIYMADHLPGRVTGFDLSREAAFFWKLRGFRRVCNASVNQIPFASEAFDIVVCVDVMECADVTEPQAIAEMFRVMKPGGYLCLVVPAFDSLMSRRHHQAVHAVRRYSKRKLRELFSKYPVQEKVTRYIFGPVFPLIALYRWGNKVFPSRDSGPPRSELVKFPAWLDWILYKTVSIERCLISRFEFPFGSSIVTLVRKGL